jgi:hypothetical protein
MEPSSGIIPVCTGMEREREDLRLRRLILPRVGAVCFNVTSGVRGSNRRANRQTADGSIQGVAWIDPDGCAILKNGSA